MAAYTRLVYFFAGFPAIATSCTSAKSQSVDQVSTRTSAYASLKSEITSSAGRVGAGGPSEGGAVTDTVSAPLATVEPREAVIVAVPDPTRTTSPEGSTDATAELEDWKVK